MKDRSHDEAMAELFKEDQALAVGFLHGIFEDGDQEDLAAAVRQMDRAGLFDRTGVLYEVACDVLGAIITHHSEAIARERERPDPDLKAIEKIEALKRALKQERDDLNPSRPEAINAVITKYGCQARQLYQLPSMEQP